MTFSVNEHVYSLIYYDLFEWILFVIDIVVYFVLFYTFNQKIVDFYSKRKLPTTFLYRWFYSVGRYGAKIAAIVTIGLVLYFKIQNLVKIDQPISIVSGLVQRHKIFEKLDGYQDEIPYYDYGRGRRGGLLTVGAYWYKKPTSFEMEKLKEYLFKIFNSYDELLKENKICPSKKYPSRADLYTVRKESIRMSRSMIKTIKKLDKQSEVGSELKNNVDYLIPKALEQYFACPENKQLTNQNPKSETKKS